MDNKSQIKYSKSKLTNSSKFLALVLRHKAKDYGIEIEPSGYVKLSDVINLHQAKGLKLTEELVKEIVSHDQKGRYQLEDRPPLYIRAVQGHSMSCVSNEETLTKVVNIFKYPTIVHGTDSVAWGFIEKTGLNKMARNAIHFSIGYSQEDHVKSGMRNTCDIYIEINAIEAFYNSIPFYISVNNVVLSAGIEGVIPTKYIKKVTKKGVGIIYAEHYVYSVYLDANTNTAIILKEGVEIGAEGNVSLNDCDSLNKFAELFINNGTYTKEAFIVLINYDLKENYCAKISQYTENCLLLFPGFYIDHIASSQDIPLKDYAKILNAKMMEKVNVNWKKYYEHMDKKKTVLKPKEEVIINLSSSSSSGSDYEKLTTDIIKDNTKLKHYIIIYVNTSEGNITLIKYMIIYSNDSDQYNMDISFENKTTKQGLNAFIDSLKQALTDQGILNKRLIVCIRLSDKDILIKSLSKQSIQIPKLLNRNQIILSEAMFSSIAMDGNFDHNVIESFKANYIHNEEQINALVII